jgi:hypothetical protein
MRRMKARLLGIGLSLAMALVGALAMAPARAVGGHGQPAAGAVRAIGSGGAAGSLADFVEISRFGDDGLLDWGTVMFLLFGDAVETPCHGDSDPVAAAPPGEDDPADRCDPHPDTPK